MDYKQELQTEPEHNQNTARLGTKYERKHEKNIYLRNGTYTDQN